LLARYSALPGGAFVSEATDLIALSSEVHPHPQAADLGATLGLELDARGYLQASRPGIYLAGGVLGTVGVEAGAEQARAVVRAALKHLRPQQAATGQQATGPELQKLEQMLHALIRLGGQA